MVMTGALDAGNNYDYCASRSLFGLALGGEGPEGSDEVHEEWTADLLRACLLLISLLSVLQVSNSASVVLSWFVNLVRFFVCAL